MFMTLRPPALVNEPAWPLFRPTRLGLEHLRIKLPMSCKYSETF
jgi:hypothetical protein